MIEDAWGCRIRPYDENEKYGKDFIKRMETIIDESGKPGSKIVETRIMSNSNEMDMYRLMLYLYRRYPLIFFHPDKIEHGSDTPALLIGRINGKPVYLDVSYRYQQFKLPGQEQSFIPDVKPLRTDYLIRTLSNHLKTKEIPLDQICVISQWPGDVKQAERMGMSAHSADKVLPSIHYTNKTDLAAAGMLGIGLGAIMPFSPVLTGLVVCGLASVDWALGKSNLYDPGPRIRAGVKGLSLGSLAGQLGAFAAYTIGSFVNPLEIQPVDVNMTTTLK